MGFRELVFFTALFSFVNWFNQVPWLAVAESYEEIDSNNLNGLYLTVISVSNFTFCSSNSRTALGADSYRTLPYFSNATHPEPL